MRKSRIKVQGQTAVYHCITRIVGGAFLLEDDSCKEVLRKQLRRVSEFCGVEILTYCIMSNHLHVLVRVPLAPFRELSDRELLRRCEVLYGHDDIAMTQWQNRLGNPEKREQWRESLIGRMGDVSMFMKELKQRFSTWYNKTHNRYGTLWAERFKSVLVEDNEHSLMMVAAYIDLNPVRAGIVEDPKDYRFCGYAEGLSSKTSKVFCVLRTLIANGYSSTRAFAEYRKLLYGVGAYGKHSNGPRLDGAEVDQIMLDQGNLTKSELLQHRVRYFTDGAVIGSKSFVQNVFHDNRELFGKRKTDRSKYVPFAGNDSIVSLRNLRTQVVT